LVGLFYWHYGNSPVSYFDLVNLFRFVRSVEETVIQLLKCYGLDGERSSINSGVWIANRKISAVGITASRWITMHGASFNVYTNMRNFDKIIPCGIDERIGGVCRLKDLLTVNDVTIPEIGISWVDSFRQVFGQAPLHETDSIHELERLVSLHPIDEAEIIQKFVGTTIES
jgi:lipoate-protein ligase B